VTIENVDIERKQYGNEKNNEIMTNLQNNEQNEGIK